MMSSTTAVAAIGARRRRRGRDATKSWVGVSASRSWRRGFARGVTSLGRSPAIVLTAAAHSDPPHGGLNSGPRREPGVTPTTSSRSRSGRSLDLVGWLYALVSALVLVGLSGLQRRPLARSSPRWLEANPNVTFHFTPVGYSWMNQNRDLVRHNHQTGDPPRTSSRSTTSSNASAPTSNTGTPTPNRSSGPPRPRTSSPRSAWSKSASGSSYRTTRSNANRISRN